MVRSLVDMCKNVAVRNISKITDGLGDTPTKYIIDILRAVKTGEQLHQLEENTPDIYDLTAEHWRRIIESDFPKMARENNWVPKNPKSWYKVWLKYKKTHEANVAAATEKMRAYYVAEQKKKEERHALFIEMSRSKELPAPPKRGSHWSTSTERIKPSPLAKVKLQARKESRMKRTIITGVLGANPSQLTRAPEHMIRDKRIERQPEIPPPPATMTPAVRAPGGISGRNAGREQREREARLLRIKGAGSSANVLSFDDDDDEAGLTSKGGVLDDLFGELESSEPSPPRRAATPRRQETQVSRPPVGRPSDSVKPLSASIAATKSEVAARAEADRRRRGLLSAAPGSSTVTRRQRPVSPPDVKQGGVSPLAPKPASSPVPGPVTRAKRKAAPDFFMLPNKRPHR
jgi:elongin-A